MICKNVYSSASVGTGKGTAPQPGRPACCELCQWPPHSARLQRASAAIPAGDAEAAAPREWWKHLLRATPPWGRLSSFLVWVWDSEMCSLPWTQSCVWEPSLSPSCVSCQPHAVMSPGRPAAESTGCVRVKHFMCRILKTWYESTCEVAY